MKKIKNLPASSLTSPSVNHHTNTNTIRDAMYNAMTSRLVRFGEGGDLDVGHDRDKVLGAAASAASSSVRSYTMIVPSMAYAVWYVELP